MAHLWRTSSVVVLVSSAEQGAVSSGVCRSAACITKVDIALFCFARLPIAIER